ncbi:MAG: AAA family ATPase [Muribaculum sp.]|nr:AAA family ATPase [Muribaculum sp.]
MIIKEIRIKNFRSYYGDNNQFDFSDGLTVIIGDNGDGKTTFFEALQWLFDTTIDKSSLEQISEMRKSQMETGDTDEVSVCMKFDHNGEKSVEKTFSFERLDNGGFRLGKITYRGYETNGTDREAVNGKALIERCYDAFIQKFSMFKGEAELNVFENRTLLKDLVDKFSDIRKFDDLVTMAQGFEDKSNRAYLKEISSDKKVSQRAKELESQISRHASDIDTTRHEIKEKRGSIETYNKSLSDLEENQEASERYKDIKDRLKTQEERRNKLMAQIGMVNYNHALLDRMWILAPFSPILKIFQEKISALSKTKRAMDREFERTKAIELGKLEAAKEMLGALANGATELPWYLPNQETMEEMIHDHICKVCGREAPEGSEAYEFMVHKLEEYRRHTEAKLLKESQKKEIQKQELFPFEYIEQLHNVSVSLSGLQEAQVAGYAQEIADRQGLVARLQDELKKTQQKIQDLIDEKTRLLIQVGNLSETTLEKEFNDIRGLYQSRERATSRLTELETELKYQEKQMAELKKELDELDPESSQVKVMREVHSVLEAIAAAFTNAKKENLRRFLTDLEEKANEYLVKLSASDFHGEIRLVQTTDESTEIRLFSSNGTEIKKPSGSQKTVMYISILFAISDFTQEKRDEDYPLIFDAATSSFGDSKEEDFYNVIDKLHKQCIIVTKDFIEKGKLNEEAIAGLTCNVYRIRKAANFDQSNMATIRTLIEKIR